ncbi:XRE family transcriptional regulator [Thalassospira sp. UBA1131]|jgi:transcriptional regulator with XRE-family HTH domain|uniref:XRE family transcriptional regulator n=1 Tax=Thalassospira sp. UBA1131 TaxID=1947672 RepID=UPI0025E08F12|nr:XRE family transcriptional regulator [Thalassospira sp. UBA1131]
MITGSQIRAARAIIKITAQQLAELAEVGLMTVRRAESFDDTVPNINKPNLSAIQTALESKGVIFISENGEGAGVRLRKS